MDSSQTFGEICVIWVRGDIISKSPLASSLEEEEAGLDLRGNQESLPFRYFRFLQCEPLVKGGISNECGERDEGEPPLPGMRAYQLGREEQEVEEKEFRHEHDGRAMYQRQQSVNKR